MLTVMENLAVVLKEKPARWGGLQAASTLKDYMEDMDEPFAQELETFLAKFGHRTCLDEFRALQPTLITDYFNYKL
ncbi:hypothetical protein H2248_011479 [Termitomyces sp. 'cryptogamus']|nr:hypothetical protein H2248_011479 [Termitomyces sp. 'cryptogamus']